ncbi:MAG: hypothetical protein K0R66_1431 [Gammaproteobacteria bacterium]|jgi:hypothetical protein|nr:hypothetical protein [Gammaproteobacteria bacterium]
MAEPTVKTSCLHDKTPIAKLEDTEAEIIYSLTCPGCSYKLTTSVSKSQFRDGSPAAWSCCDRDFLMALWSVNNHLLSFETQLQIVRQWEELEDPILEKLS